MATAVQATPGGLPREIRIISHSGLFYWWPVWAFGFIFALVTLIDGHLMAPVPVYTEAKGEANIPGYNQPRDVYVLPDKKSIPIDPNTGNPQQPKLHITTSRIPGVWFCIILLVVIFITNVPLRGLWSVIVISFILFLSIIFATLGWWDNIINKFSLLDIRITMGGYLLIAIVLLIIWVLTIFFFDRQIYMVFTPGQLRVHLEIGGGEVAYDTTGMTIQKQRSDLFRHLFLGFGSGDLIVRTSGAQAHHFDLPNVLILGRRVREIEDMLRSRQVVTGP